MMSDSVSLKELKNCMIAEEGYDAPKPTQVGEAVLEGSTEAKAALLMATAKARGEFGKAFRDATGQFENRRFKYTPLPALEDASVPSLAKHGLVLLQIPAGPQDGRFLLHNWLCHEGGAILKSTLSFSAPKNQEGDTNNKGAKQVGAVFSYMARYFVKTFWGLDGGEDDDIDRPEHNEPKEPRGDSQKAPAPRQEKSRQQAAPQAPKQLQAPRSEAPPPAPDARQVELPGSSGSGMSDEQLDGLKLKIKELGLKLTPPVTTVPELIGYAEKLLKLPFEEIRNSPNHLTALHHCMKVELDNAAKRAPADASGSDPREPLLAQVQELGKRLGTIGVQTNGRLVRAQLAQYVYTAMGGAVFDDVMRDPEQLQRLIERMQRDINEFPHEQEAQP
jgi:hypothetical protein